MVKDEIKVLRFLSMYVVFVFIYLFIYLCLGLCPRHVDVLRPGIKPQAAAVTTPDPSPAAPQENASVHFKKSDCCVIRTHMITKYMNTSVY